MAVKPVYDVGDMPVVSAAFQNVSGIPTAPTAVTVKVRKPDGTTTTTTSPDVSITLGATTTYTFPATLDQSGEWVVRIAGTAGVVAAAEIAFTVRPSAFP